MSPEGLNIVVDDTSKQGPPMTTTSGMTTATAKNPGSERREYAYAATVSRFLHDFNVGSLISLMEDGAEQSGIRVREPERRSWLANAHALVRVAEMLPSDAAIALARQSHLPEEFVKFRDGGLQRKEFAGGRES